MVPREAARILEAMRTTLLSALVTGLSLLPLAPAAADVHITISDGFVSVDAKDATVRQILTEWARVGQTRVVNAERIAGAPVSLRLVRVPEAQALDILLRSVSGYLAAPRAVPIDNASQFDRILVMPTSTPPRVTAAAATPVQAAAAPFQPPQMPNAMDEVEMEDAGVPPPGLPAQRGPVFPQFPNPMNGAPSGPPGSFPQRSPAFPQTGSPFPIPNGGPAQTVNPNQPFPTGTVPGAAPGGVVMPPGVSTPGMVAPAPQSGPGAPPEPQ